MKASEKVSNGGAFYLGCITSVYACFFFSLGNHQVTPSTLGGAEGNLRHLLTKTHSVNILNKFRCNPWSVYVCLCDFMFRITILSHW